MLRAKRSALRLRCVGGVRKLMMMWCGFTVSSSMIDGVVKIASFHRDNTQLLYSTFIPQHTLRSQDLSTLSIPTHGFVICAPSVMVLVALTGWYFSRVCMDWIISRAGIDSSLQRPKPKPQRNVCAPVRRSQLDAVHGHVRQRREFLRELSILLRADVGRE